MLWAIYVAYQLAGGGIRSVGKTWLGNDLFAGTPAPSPQAFSSSASSEPSAGGSTAGRCLFGSEWMTESMTALRAESRTEWIDAKRSA
jgi:hypothetical protein